MQRFVMVELPLPHFEVNTDVETDDRIQQAAHVKLGSCSVLLAPIASCAGKGSRIKNRRVQVEVVNTISITNAAALRAYIHLRNAAQETRQES
jgi:hypothetical protein